MVMNLLPAVEDELVGALSKSYIRGLTLIGGEPLSRKISRGCWKFCGACGVSFPIRMSGVTAALRLKN